MGVSVRIAPVRARRVRNHSRIKLLTKLTAQLRDAALCVFRELLGGGAVLNGMDGLAGVVLKILEQAVQLLLHLADFVPLLSRAFRCQPCLLALDLSLALLQLQAPVLRFP